MLGGCNGNQGEQQGRDVEVMVVLVVLCDSGEVAMRVTWQRPDVSNMDRSVQRRVWATWQQPEVVTEARAGGGSDDRSVLVAR